MKKLRKNNRFVNLGIASDAGSIISISASWASQINVTPPPWGGTVLVEEGVVKETNSAAFSVKGIKEHNTFDPYARLVNSNEEERSDWVPIRQGEINTSNSNTGVKNYIYYTIAGSNNLELNSNLISYSFDPF